MSDPNNVSPEMLEREIFILENVLLPMVHHSDENEGHEQALVQAMLALASDTTLVVRMVEMFATFMVAKSILENCEHSCDYIHMTIDTYKEALAQFN